jgi:signal transduction histidine kinase
VKESIVANLDDIGWRWLLRRWSWIVVSVALATIPFTAAFVPAHSTDARRILGLGYYVYMWSLLGLYSFMFVHAFRSSSSLAGGRRLELQIWLGGGCAMVSSVILTMALNAMTGDRIYIRLQPLFVLLFYGGIAFAISAHRIFDARQIVILTIEKTLLLSAIASLAFCLDRTFELLIPEAFAFIATTAISLWAGIMLNGWLNRKFHFYPQATMAREAAFTAARQQARLEDLQNALVSVVKGWGQSENAVLLSGWKGSLVGGGIDVPVDGPVVTAMRQLRWATPERLGRERPTPSRAALSEFLVSNALAVLVFAEGPELSALVGVGYGAARRPFTYPQVTQLLELASIIESALERAHFSAKVQHTEQLATVGLLGASLAHEIRNPLVSIKTFVQLLPSHHHDAAFREKFFRLITDEVTRIDQLTEQLLDLASPRAYSPQMIELHPVLTASLELAAAKAAHRKIQFLTDFQARPDRAFTDASAAKQVMLNLCFNAIQAVESHNGDSNERWVKIVTRNTEAGVEMAVADSGPGIDPEIRPKLFQPFQTTKSTGFGLGLAICSDILANLHATISVDPPTPGRGATFRVIFPCQPSSS